MDLYCSALGLCFSAYANSCVPVQSTPWSRGTAGADGGVIVVDGPTSALVVAECTSCLPNSFTGAATTITTLAGCQCGPGYQGQLDDTSEAMCTQCPQDTFKSTAGVQPCTQCASYATTIGATGALSSVSCICSRGYTGNGTLCTECAVNTYKASRGDGVCVACTADSTTVSNVAAPRVGACICDVGYEALSGSLQTSTSTCEPCATNTYKDAQAAQLCTSCTANSATNGTTGSVIVDACLCNPGYTGNLSAADALCMPCEVGRHKSAIGTADCVACPLYSSTLSRGASSVDHCLCTIGWYGLLNTRGSECTKCAAGMYKSVQGTDDCLQCPVGAGTVGVEGSISVYNCSCQVGNEIRVVTTRMLGTVTTCEVCSPGAFKQSAGPEMCNQCTPHSGTVGINGSIAVTACLCDPGYLGSIMNLSSTCTACPVDNFKANSGTMDCALCTDVRNFTSSNGLSGRSSEDACICVPGYGIVGGATVCQDCEAGRFKEVHGHLDCTDCTARSSTHGTTTSPTVDSCLCDIGHFSARPVGTNGEFVFHAVCSDASVSTEAACLAIEIPASCSDNAVSAEAACLAIETPASCSDNTVSAEAACLALNPPGTWTAAVPNPGTWAAAVPNPGSWTAAGLTLRHYTCERCPQDTYKAAIGPADCATCPNNAVTDTVTGSIAVTACLCNLGYQGTLAHVSDTCSPCVADKYKSVIGTELCVQCTASAGTVGESAKTAVGDCQCDPGYTSGGPELDSPTATCTVCAPSKVKSHSGPEECTDCTAHASTWMICNAGSIADGRCAVAGVMFADIAVTDVSECKCDPGYTGLIQQASDVCSGCPVDTFKEDAGPGRGALRLCDDCTASSSTGGTTAAELVSMCHCNPGYDGNINGASDLCTECAVDTYKGVSGNDPTMCVACPGGFNTNGTTTAVACLCNPGYEFRITGAQGAFCYQCLPGFYKENSGPAPCNSCPANSNTYKNTPTGFMNLPPNDQRELQDGSIFVADCQCDMGYSGAVINAGSICNACPMSSYKALVGDSPCVQCTTNAATSAVGTMAVYNCLCRPGYFGNTISASSVCTVCARSKYKSVSGASPCIPCPANSGTCDNDGVCTTAVAVVRECVCAPGWYGRLTYPSARCSQCRANSYKSDHSIYNCNGCPEGSSTFGVAGSMVPEDCICDAGYFGTITGRFDRCHRCAVATYKGSRGPQLCSICPENMVTDMSNISLAVSDCFCALGYVGRPNAQGLIDCIMCAWDMLDPTGCSAFPPQASVLDLEHQHKVSPTKKLALLGSYATRPDPNEPVTFAWQAWEELPDNSSKPMDLYIDGFLAGSQTGLNLIVREGSLEESKRYRFRMIATGIIASSSADSIFTVNVRPANGSLTVSPTLGVALEDRFIMTAVFWYDEDLPLSYKYGFEIRENRKWLTSATGKSSTKAMLPPGSGGVNISSANFTNVTSTDGSIDSYKLIVRVADAYAASRDARTNVTVMPYVKVEGISWADDMLSKTAKATCSPLRCGRTNKCNDEDPYCAPFDELHEVRCCADAEIPKWRTPKGQCVVWGASMVDKDCLHAATYEEAQDFCKAAGAAAGSDVPPRLCTAAELEVDCTRGTGCGHDEDLIWSNVGGGDDDEEEIDASAANTVAALTLNTLDTSEEDVATEEVDLDAGCTSSKTCAELKADYGGWPTWRGSAEVCGESDSGFGYVSAAPEGAEAVAVDEDPQETCLASVTVEDSSDCLAAAVPFTISSGDDCVTSLQSGFAGCVQTKNYPSSYDRNGRCTITVNAAGIGHFVSSSGHKCGINCVSWAFDVEPKGYGSTCHDYLKRGSAKYCSDNNHPPASFALSSGERLYWYSDSSDQRKGFRICMEGSDAPPDCPAVGSCTDVEVQYKPRQNREWRGSVKMDHLSDYPIAGVDCDKWDSGSCISEEASWSIYTDCKLFRNTHSDYYELQECAQYAGAVCASICASVPGCQGFQLKAHAAGHCSLHNGLTVCDSSAAIASDTPCVEEDDICLGGFCAMPVVGLPHRKPVAGLGSDNPSLAAPAASTPADECVSKSTWSEAITTCIGVGGRLCTQLELQGNEAAGTGCLFGAQEKLWTSDDVECTAGNHMTVPAQSVSDQEDEGGGAACMADEDKNAVKCCADTVVSMDVCVDPNGPLAVTLTGDLTNARTVLISKMGNATAEAGDPDASTMASGAVESLTGSPDQLTGDSMDASGTLLENMVGSTGPAPEISGSTPPQISGSTPPQISGSVAPEVSTDGAQAMVTATSNILSAANQAAEQALMLEQQQALEAERLEQKAACRAECVESHPPVEATANECLEFGASTCVERDPHLCSTYAPPPCPPPYAAQYPGSPLLDGNPCPPPPPTTIGIYYGRRMQVVPSAEAAEVVSPMESVRAMCPKEVLACTADSGCRRDLRHTLNRHTPLATAPSHLILAVMACIGGNQNVNATNNMRYLDGSEAPAAGETRRRRLPTDEPCQVGQRHGTQNVCLECRCERSERECLVDTYLDTSGQDECKLQCDEQHSRRHLQFRRRMQEVTGSDGPSHPKHIHLVNQMLKKVHHHGHGRRALLVSELYTDEIAAVRAGSMLGVLGGIGQAVAGGMLAGEEPNKIDSSMYSLEVQQFAGTGVEGAALGGGSVAVPVGENLTKGQQVSAQTVAWARNPYAAVGGADAAEDPTAALSSQVVTVRLLSLGGEMAVGGLSETFNVTLSRNRATPEGVNGTDPRSNTSCSSMTCINSYDVAHDLGACDAVMRTRGYTCEADFCDGCLLAGFCDLSCDPSCAPAPVQSNATNTSSSSEAMTPALEFSPNCTLDPSPSCTYWDVSRMSWRTDGVVLNVTETTVTCAFKHLTDFAAMMSPPAQTSELADLSDTFDLYAFARDNLVGLILSLFLFFLVICITFTSICTLRKQARSKVRHKVKTDVVKKTGKYAEFSKRFPQIGEGVMTFSARTSSMLPTRLRSNYLCGSLFQPLQGEPFDRWQRMLVVLCTILCTLMVNVQFFQSKHNQVELCEGPLTFDGRPSNCTGGVQERSMCYCRTFDCSAAGCDKCNNCDTIDNCGIDCPVITDNRIMQTLITVALTWPIGSLLQKLFEWLHKPYVTMVEKELRLASEADALAQVKRGNKDGKRRYGRVGKKKEVIRGRSDLEGDEGSQLWTDSDEGIEAIEEEAAEISKDDWEKEPIMPDGRLPCEECGEKPMRLRKKVANIDYRLLEERLGTIRGLPTFEDITGIYNMDELSCILLNNQLPYSYKKSGIDMQQSMDIMAWQVLRMVNSRVTQSGTYLSKRAATKAASKEFVRKAGTSWEHAMEQLYLNNPGRTISNRQSVKGAKQSKCPVCKGSGASGKVWYVTAPIRKAGEFRPSHYMKVTPAQRRMAQKSLERKRQQERGRNSKGGNDAEDKPPQLDDKADRSETGCGPCHGCGQWDLVIPYAVGLVVGLFCVVTIARIVRNFSAPRTVEWLASSVVSLVLSWTLTDPYVRKQSPPQLDFQGNIDDRLLVITG